MQDRKGLVVSEEQTKANVGKEDGREAGGTKPAGLLHPSRGKGLRMSQGCEEIHWRV